MCNRTRDKETIFISRKDHLGNVPARDRRHHRGHDVHLFIREYVDTANVLLGHGALPRLAGPLGADLLGGLVKPRRLQRRTEKRVQHRAKETRDRPQQDHLWLRRRCEQTHGKVEHADERTAERRGSESQKRHGSVRPWRHFPQTRDQAWIALAKHTELRRPCVRSAARVMANVARQQKALNWRFREVDPRVAVAKVLQVVHGDAGRQEATREHLQA
ncbi:hypothetical protein FI667_g8807, partial [Globisporangium splendens]